MEEHKAEEQSTWAKWKDNYILTIKHEDTYADKYVFRLTFLKVLGVLGGVLMLVSILTALLIAFTPLKVFIPGYQDIGDQRPFLELQREVQHLQEEIGKRDIYIQAFKAQLSGHAETEEDAMQKSVPALSERGLVPKVKEDKILRDHVVQKNRKANGFKVHLAADKKNTSIANIYFTPPVKGKVSASYMPDKNHYGVDIIAPENVPVLATLAGHVISSDWTMNTGYTIAIQHDNNLVSFYKHNSSLLKHVGDKVRMGEAIAIIGNSGVLTSGPHLHFELWHRGRPIDPEHYIIFD